MHPLHAPPKSAPAASPCTQLAKQAFFSSHSEERSSARHARRGKAPSPSRVSSAPRSLHASLSSPEKCEKLTPVLQATPPAPKLRSPRPVFFRRRCAGAPMVKILLLRTLYRYFLRFRLKFRFFPCKCYSLVACLAGAGSF